MNDASRTVYIVPHTHWDREWYETFETFRAQLVELWDELLALTEADPDFRFLMDGQSIVIDDYLEIRPENRQRLDAAIARGQIQVGPWYTLPDEFLVSGEALVRDLERGTASASAHGGTMRVGYLPDSFGHAAQMPQLYRQFGFNHAAVWRGVPLTIDRVAFIWEAPDGSTVLTAYMGNSYSHGVDLPTEPEALAGRIRSALAAIEPFRPGPDILLMNGNDHVLPQRALSAAVRQVSGRLDHTMIRLARLDQYLGVLPASPWPHWRGELRSSARANVLMGTLSVRAPDKQLYARAARTLARMAEPAASLASIDASAELARAWTLILQNAAHDTACGSGIDAVAEAARERSQTALNLAQTIVDRCLPALAADGQVWNPSPFPRQEVIDIRGKPLMTPVIPGCSTAQIENVTPDMAVTTSRDRLENALLAVALKPDGRLTVFDKVNQVAYPDLARLVDEGDAGDEYNYSPPPEPDPSFPTTLSGRDWTVLEDEPLRGRVELRFGMPIPRGLRPDRRSRTTEGVSMQMRLVATLAADSPRLDLELEVDNQATDHRLRVHFPLPFAPAESAADTPFHVTRRPVVASHRDPGAPEDELPTYPMHSFVDLSDGRVGLAVITDGLHEYEVLPPPANELAVTVLRAVGWLSRDDLATRTGHAGPQLPTPGAQVPGRHRIRYSLFFHAGDWATASVWRAAERALLPLLPGRGARAASVTPLIELQPESVQMTACIPRHDGYDLRLLNVSDRPVEAAVRLRPPPSGATRLSLGDAEGQSLEVAGGEVRLSMRRWEIVTLRIRR